MNRARKNGVLAPAVYLVDVSDRKIIMEYLGIHAITVKDFIKEMDDLDHPSLTITLVEHIATNLANLHKGDIIHGDLTTSNMMIRPFLPLEHLF